jgi:hypothetical protein
MLASSPRALTPANYFVAETEPRPLLVIEGILFIPRADERGRPVWHGANGHTVSLSRLDDIMDADIAVSYIPSFPVTE